MDMIGYGEDGLTFCALNEHLSKLLKLLKDPSEPDQCKVYYRPSFGRAGGSKSSQFGEFDAIVATDKTVFLFESKWDRAGRLSQVVTLKEVQALRHQIFDWLYQSWADWQEQCEPTNWEQFKQHYGDEFRQRFPSRPIAPSGSLLARNLEHVLRDLTNPRRQIRNVVLYFHQVHHRPPERLVKANASEIPPAEFTLLPFAYETIANSGYFQLRVRPERAEE